MRCKRIPLMLCLLILVTSCQSQAPTEKESGNEPKDASLEAREVTYGENFKGYLVTPKKTGKYPGVIMIHEWWGLNQNIKEMANTLAKEGYLVLAVDLYEGKIAETAEDAQAYATEVRKNQDRAILQMREAVAYLKEQKGYAGKMASLGWCFGGGMSLQLSLEEDLDATVIYYGTLVTDTSKLAALKSPVLGIFGDQDTSIPVDTIHQFEEALTELKIQHEVKIYEGVGHAFANPSNPNHDPKSTKNAWKKTLAFLDKYAKQ